MNLQNARRALKQEDNRDFNFKPELMCENKMKLSNKKEMMHPKEKKKIKQRMHCKVVTLKTKHESKNNNKNWFI